MLQNTQHIEGLSNYEDFELFDDTPPGEVQVKFYVESEEMPYLSEREGRIIRKNFVHVSAEWDLGRSKWSRRIRDKVEFDDATQKWVIAKLARNSDIKRWPTQWNAFMRGSSEDITGTPLSLLFKTDPSKVEMYKFKHISTVEHLASLSEATASDLGMGGREDVQKAKKYLERVKENSSTAKVTAALEEKDRIIHSLQSQLNDLADKFSKFIENQNEEKPRRGRPAKSEQQETQEGI